MSDQHDDPRIRAPFDQLRHDTANVDTMAALRQMEGRRRPLWFGPAMVGTATTVVLIVIGIAVWNGTENEEVVTTVTDTASQDGAGVTAETLDGSSWVFESGFGSNGEIAVVDGFPITLTFRGQELGGTAACNGYGGFWQTDGSSFAIEGLGRNEMGCRPDVMESEAGFLAALQDIDRFSAAAGELVLSGPSSELKFRLDAPVPTAELVGQLWLLDGLIQGEGISSTFGQPATLLLNADGTLEGGTGCRSLSGEYVISGASVQFTSFSAGDGSCPGDLRIQDNIVITVLEGFTAEVDGDRLTLTAPGNEGLTYKAIDELPDESPDLDVTNEGLDGTSWVLVEGIGPEGEIMPSVEFPVVLSFEGATVVGRAPCNPYEGSFELDEMSIVFGNVTITPFGCSEEANTTALSYVAALESVTHITLDGDFLILAGEGTELNFQSQESPEPPVPPASEEEVPDGQMTAGALLDLRPVGQTTVVGHLLNSGGGWILCDQLSSDETPRCISRWVVIANSEVVLSEGTEPSTVLRDGTAWSETSVALLGELRDDGRFWLANSESTAEAATVVDTDRSLLDGFTAMIGVDQPAVDVDLLKLAAGGVQLGLGSDLLVTRTPDELADPTAWLLEDETFRARVGPFSAIDLLARAAEVTTLAGPHDHCAAPPIPVPAGLEDARHLSIQPADATSCLEWWSVDLFLDAAGDVVAITLDLWEP